MTKLILPGDVGFDKIHGLGHLTVGPGQLLMGDASRFEHVRLALTNQEFAEAKPPRAEINRFDQSKHGDTVWFRLPLTSPQRALIDVMVRRDFELDTIRYAWTAYANIALLKWGFRPEWLKKHVEFGKRRICSQLADDYLTLVGYDVLEGVLPGEVTPGDMFHRFALDPLCLPFRVDGKSPWIWK